VERERLIYDLIFSETAQFQIDLRKYVEDVYHYDEFIEEIKSILKKAGVEVIQSTVVVNSSSSKWTLKVKK
jgi:hypothetical protein